MKIAVIGSRDLNDKTFIVNFMEQYTDTITSTYNEDVVILLGGASGVQEVVQDWARDEKVDYILFKPWHLVDTKLSFTPKLFFMRNKQIIDNAHRVVVMSNGTNDSEVDRAIEYAKKRGKDVEVVHFDSASL